MRDIYSQYSLSPPTSLGKFFMDLQIHTERGFHYFFHQLDTTLIALPYISSFHFPSRLLLSLLMYAPLLPHSTTTIHVLAVAILQTNINMPLKPVATTYLSKLAANNHTSALLHIRHSACYCMCYGP